MDKLSHLSRSGFRNETTIDNMTTDMGCRRIPVVGGTICSLPAYEYKWTGKCTQIELYPQNAAHVHASADHRSGAGQISARPMHPNFHQPDSHNQPCCCQLENLTRGRIQTEVGCMSSSFILFHCISWGRTDKQGRC